MKAVKPCQLQDALGRVEPCPGESCPLWEAGGAVVEAGCLIKRLELDLPHRPGLAGFLLELRQELALQSTDPGDGWRLFHLLTSSSGR